MRRRPGARPVLRLIPHPKQRLQRRSAKRQAQTLFEVTGNNKKGTSRNVRNFQSIG